MSKVPGVPKTSETQAQKIYDEVKGSITNGKLTMASLATLVIELMQMVERLKIGGSERKQIVLDVIKVAIVESPMTDDERSVLNTTASFVIPVVIDGIIAASKSELALNMKKKILWCC